MPLRYHPATVDGMTVLAHDRRVPGRIVEVLGDLDRAEAVAVLVPGNAHCLGNYHLDTGGASPRANGRQLHEVLRRLAPDAATAVVVWLGYRCPRGFVAGARRRAAVDGARDLARLTAHVPDAARLTLIGHSYGSLVCALATERTHVDDLVALASPGLGVRHASDLRIGGRVWATRAHDDWVRFLPRGRLGGFGHGRQPTDRGFGATSFSSAGVRGHSGYYAPTGEAIHNIARIVVGRHDEVTGEVASDDVTHAVLARR